VKSKTTINPTERVAAIVRRLAGMSGMSLTGVYSLGALTLAAQHARAMEFGAKRQDLLQEIREAFEAEMKKVEESTD
jgi:hypothetical protein